MEALLRFAAGIGATSIHITVGAPPLLRVDGDLCPIRDLAVPGDDRGQQAADFIATNSFWEMVVTPAIARRVAAELFARPELRERFEQTGTVRFVKSLPGMTRFLVSVFRQRGNPAVVCRALGRSVPSLEDVFRHLPEVKEAVERMLATGEGLILVGGPTGSGKAATLAAMVDFINRTSPRHVITVENPIRYLHRHARGVVNQREVGEDVDNFENGVKSALYSDADVIVAGDVPDAGTADAVVVAAETGRLTVCAVRAASAEETVARVARLIPAQESGGPVCRLAAVLHGVVVQKAICGADGGRVVAAGVLPAVPPLKDVLLAGDVTRMAAILHSGSVDGAFPLERALAKLAATDIIDRAKAECRAGDADLFWRFLKLY
ncbi:MULTISPECIES: type IV pilus twitching motility protein PilT [unclassified Neomoorella]|uniref:type IV pilus twitching motility protein PilT n=1 Tax=unclassified Neomoorella TaxID=2676739 RepID=UPI0011446991|nr:MULTISPECIES: ATPase, T2SS/T4P/T4SS family [unclassified Moorella (in: firmicutes)]